MIVFATDALKCNPHESGIWTGNSVLFRLSRWAIIKSGLLCWLLCLGLTGCHKAPHSVTLSWKAPPSDAKTTIVGYNIYRRTDYSNTFVKLASRVPGPPYEDRLVSNGRTYIYAVTALDQEGHESPFSAETRATIP
jgi:hypothetical protein